MMRFGICAVSSDAPPPAETWGILRNLGITDMRLSVSLPRVFPKPDVVDWSSVHAYADPAIAAGMRIYFNTIWCPAWASGGQPAYVGLIEHDPVTNAAEGTAWWNNPGYETDLDRRGDIRSGRPQLAAGIHYFGDQPDIDFPKPPVAYVPDRPYLKNPPGRDLGFLRKAGASGATEFGNKIESWGFENEPGDPFFNPPIRGDFVNGGPLGDTVKDRFIKETQAFTEGVRSVLPNATIIGPEAEGDGILDRCCDAEHALGVHIYDVLSFHPYQDDQGPFPDRSYQRLNEGFLPVARKWRNNRPLYIGEINAPGDQLLAWSQKVIQDHGNEISAIYYLERQTFLANDNKTITPIGQQFGQLFASVNNRRRAAGRP